MLAILILGNLFTYNQLPSPPRSCDATCKRLCQLPQNVNGEARGEGCKLLPPDTELRFHVVDSSLRETICLTTTSERVRFAGTEQNCHMGNLLNDYFTQTTEILSGGLPVCNFCFKKLILTPEKFGKHNKDMYTLVQVNHYLQCR